MLGQLQHILDVAFSFACYQQAVELARAASDPSLGPGQQRQALELSRLMRGKVRFEHRLPELEEWDLFIEQLQPRYEQTPAFLNTFSKQPLLKLAHGESLGREGFMGVRHLLDFEQLRGRVPVDALRYLDMICYKIDAEEYNMEMSVFLSELLQRLEGGVEFLLDQLLPLARVLAVKSSEEMKRKEGPICIVLQILYEALLEDSGERYASRLLELHASVVKIMSMVYQKQEFYSGELKVRLRLVSNFLYPFELLIKNPAGHEVAEHFARRLETRLEQFGPKEGEYSFKDLQKDFNLGHLYSLQPESPLVEVLACLKIFNLMLRSSTLKLVSFLEHDVLFGCTCLLRKVGALLHLATSEQAQHVYNRQFLDRDRLLKSYLMVLEPLLVLFRHKSGLERVIAPLPEEKQETEAILDLAILLAKLLSHEQNPDFHARMSRCLRTAIQVLLHHSSIARESQKDDENSFLRRLIKLLLARHQDFEARPFLFVMHALLSRNRHYERHRGVEESRFPEAILRFVLYSSNTQLLEAVRLFCRTLFENTEHEPFLKLMKHLEKELKEVYNKHRLAHPQNILRLLRFYESIGDHPSPAVHARINKFDEIFFSIFNEPCQELPFKSELNCTVIRCLAQLYRRENSFVSGSARDYESALEVASVRSQNEAIKLTLEILAASEDKDLLAETLQLQAVLLLNPAIQGNFLSHLYKN